MSLISSIGYTALWFILCLTPRNPLISCGKYPRGFKRGQILDFVRRGGITSTSIWRVFSRVLLRKQPYDTSWWVTTCCTVHFEALLCFASEKIFWSRVNSPLSHHFTWQTWKELLFQRLAYLTNLLVQNLFSIRHGNRAARSTDCGADLPVLAQAFPVPKLVCTLLSRISKLIVKFLYAK